MNYPIIHFPLLLLLSLSCSHVFANFRAGVGIGAGAFQSGMHVNTTVTGGFVFSQDNKNNMGRVAYPINVSIGYTFTTPSSALSGIGVQLNYRYLNSPANVEYFKTNNNNSGQNITFLYSEWTYHLLDQTNLSTRYTLNLSPKTSFFAGLGLSYQRIKLNDLHLIEGPEETESAEFEEQLGFPPRWSTRGHAMGGLVEIGISQAINKHWSLSEQATYGQYQSIKGLRKSEFTITQNSLQQTFSRTPRSLDLSLLIAYHF